MSFHETLVNSVVMGNGKPSAVRLLPWRGRSSTASPLEAANNTEPLRFYSRSHGCTVRTWQVGESNQIYLRCASKNRFWNGINQKISKQKHKTWEKFYKIFGNLYIVFLFNHVRETIKFCVQFCYFASYLTTLSPWFKHHQYKLSVYKYFKWNESAFNFHFKIVPHCRDFSCTISSENVCFWWIMSTHAAYVEAYNDLLQCSNLI